MPIITKELAQEIRKKLKAKVDTGSNRPHDIARVYDDDDILVTSFGIRRGSKKELGHDHIPDRLHISPKQARDLGQCPLSREDWLEILAEKGLL